MPVKAIFGDFSLDLGLSVICKTLYHIILYHIILYYINYIIICYVILYYTILHYIFLYYINLYYIQTSYECLKTLQPKVISKLLNI